MAPGTSALLLVVPVSREPGALEVLSPLAGREIACTRAGTFWWGLAAPGP
ncbi:MAG: hypothetical protein JST08_11885 [Actinobacteria bacterium]|nr:hypothetical protein [Actinomycetota bacterium]